MYIQKLSRLGGLRHQSTLEQGGRRIILYEADNNLNGSCVELSVHVTLTSDKLILPIQHLDGGCDISGRRGSTLSD
jgi:hypothetical protein